MPDQTNKSYGEPLKHDPDFKGPLSKRSCTDVLCLLFFIAALCGWAFVGGVAFRSGNLNRLLVPVDSNGLRCGVDSEVVGKPYLLFFDLGKCASPMVPLSGCPTTQVCVEKCPSTTFFFDRKQCTASNLAAIKDSLICSKAVSIPGIKSCDEIDEHVQAETCAKWYLKSSSFFKRCISDLPSSECPLIKNRNRYLKRLRRSTSPALMMSGGDSQFELDMLRNQSDRQIAPAVNDFYLQPQQLRGQEEEKSEKKCAENRRLGRFLIEDKVEKTDTYLGRFVGNLVLHITNATHTQEAQQSLHYRLDELYQATENLKILATINGMGQMVVEDLIEARYHIAIALLLSMVFCLFYIFILRWLAAPMVWLSIAGIVSLLGLSCWYTFTEYMYLRNNPAPAHGISPNLSAVLKSYTEKANTWLVLFIISSITLVIILLVLLVLRKRIIIAIALIKEGSKAVSAVKISVLFPIFPWIFQVAVIAFGIIVAMHLASIGKTTYRIYGLENSTTCQCSPAYKDGDVCLPEEFNQYCQLKGASKGICTDAACNSEGIENPDFVKYCHAVNIFAFIWSAFFISAFGEMVLAATFATWFWTFKKSEVPFFALTKAFARTVRYHMGTLAFGSLIITICRIIRLILEYLDQKLKKYDNVVTRAIMCLLKCFFWCLEKFLKFINKNAYIMCAIHGKNFCASAGDAFNLLMRNFLRVVAVDKVSEFLFFISKLLIALTMGYATFAYLSAEFNEIKLHYIYVPSAIVFVGAYFIASIFFGVYSMAVDTLFLCFLEDYERNDGSPEKPYYMSKQLMKILGKKNKEN